MKKILAIVLAVALVAVVFCGCAATEEQATTSSEAPAETSAAASESESTGSSESAAAASYDWPQVGETANPKLVEQDPSEPLKFVFIGYSNNTYWNLIYEGVDQATEFLSAHNVTVDRVDLGSTVGVEVMNSALETAIASGYNGIVATTFVSGVENYIADAVEAGIPVVTIGGESADTAETGRLCCICADNEPVGQLVGETIADALADQPGAKFATITSQFTMENLEIKRNTATEYLESLGYECVGAYEASDSADTTYDLTTDIITADPDVAAIYCVAGGSEGCPRAVADAGKTGEIFVIGPDETEEHLEYVRTGEMSVIGQNPTGYAFDAFIYLYNNVVAGEVPETTYPNGMIAAYSQIIDQDNVDELFPE